MNFALSLNPAHAINVEAAIFACVNGRNLAEITVAFQTMTGIAGCLQADLGMNGTEVVRRGIILLDPYVPKEVRPLWDSWKGTILGEMDRLKKLEAKIDAVMGRKQ